MSNNKQSIKLYTEKEIKRFIENNVIQDEFDLYLLTPIELPSDEEIGTIAMDLYGFKATSIKEVLEYKAFKRGAKMVINKIQGGNNEQ